MRIEIIQNDQGEYILRLSPEDLDELGWHPKDTLEWTIEGDTAILSKVEDYQDVLFSIEELYMSCWGIIDDLKWHTKDDPYIKSLVEVYNFKFKKLWEVIEKLYKK